MGERYIAVLLLFATLLCGCARWPVNPEHARATLEAVNAHEVVVRAEVLSVGPSPGFWSGNVPAMQPVRYRLKEVYAGETPVEVGSEFTVYHVLVGGGNVEDSEPRLTPEIVRKGRQLILFMHRQFERRKGLFVFGDDPWGALPVSELSLPKTPSVPKLSR